MATKALFEKKYHCPIDRTEFIGFRLYPSVQEKTCRSDTYFDIPIYVASKHSEIFCDYALVEIKICPKCYFASNMDNHFKTDDPYNETIEIQDRVIRAIEQTRANREHIAQDMTALNAKKRSVADALSSIRLAINCSLILHQIDGKTYAPELPAIGNYSLRASHICLTNGMSEERHRWLKLSLEYFKKTVECEAKGAIYYRSMYQLAALAIYFREDIIASRCFETLQKESRSFQTRPLMIYSNRLRHIWQDRDEHRMPELVQSPGTAT